jgi:hypothetical protein
MQIRFNEVRTATEPHRTAVRCGSYIVEPQNREVRFEVLDIGTGTAPFRGLDIGNPSKSELCFVLTTRKAYLGYIDVSRILIH